MKHLPMHLFDLLYEISILNSKALFVQYENYGCTSFEILFEGSKQLPRKSKKTIRNLIRKNLQI